MHEYSKFPQVKTLGSYEADERAAILEFEAGYTRQIAESKTLAQYANKLVKDLHS